MFPPRWRAGLTAFNTLSRLTRVLLIAAVLWHAFMLVAWRRPALLAPLFFDVTVTSGGYGWDFNALYQAGANFLHRVDVYNTTPGERAEATPYFTPFRYLPVSAYTVGALLNLLPLSLAYAAWVGFTELCLLACLWYSWTHAPDRELAARLAIMWLFFTPYYIELMFGQFSFVQGALVFGMMTLALNTDPRKLDWRFDALWIASVLWKLNTALFGPLFLRLQRWRALGALVLLVYLTSVPYFMLYPTGLASFQANFNSALTTHELGNHGLRQLLFEFVLAVRPEFTGGGQSLQIALVAGVGALTLALMLFDPAPDLPDQLSLGLVTFFLVSHQIWEHHYTMLLPVLVIAYWRTRSRWIALCWLLLAIPTPFLPTGLYQAIAANHDLRGQPVDPAWIGVLYHAAKPLPTLGLYAFFVARIGQRIRTT